MANYETAYTTAIMAKPRVFVSSTCYDLRPIRASLELFIRSLGYEPILSERGTVPYVPGQPLDESCYVEVLNCDIYVLIIGGRYGSEISSAPEASRKEFYDRYQSIARQEHRNAADHSIPTFILVDQAVLGEYRTYQHHRDDTSIQYASVDSVNIFEFIDSISQMPMNTPMNTPMQPFQHYFDIESWLREQWAGWFRELIKRVSSQQQLASLTSEVGQLRELNSTLKTYLETLLKADASVQSQQIIESEEARLSKAKRLEIVRDTRLMRTFIRLFGIEGEVVLSTLEEAPTFPEFIEKIAENLPERTTSFKGSILSFACDSAVEEDWREARKAQGFALPPYSTEDATSVAQKTT